MAFLSAIWEQCANNNPQLTDSGLERVNALLHFILLACSIPTVSSDALQKSCKAYSFLEMDEIKDGPVVLEVYRKPANYVRNKQPELLTTKPLYLHLNLALSPT